jgi:hypothetical protein
VDGSKRTIPKREASDVGFDVRGARPETTASPTKHLSAEVDGDEERPMVSSSERFGRDQSGPGGDVEHDSVCWK